MSENMDVSYRRGKFVRSASLERIRKFNTYICSQNYYILPAILAWLKTSQNIIQTNIEKAIIYTKTYSFAAYKISLRELTKLTLATVYNSYLSTIFIYFSISLIFIQLLICLYVMSVVFLPSGLVFMLGCLYVITHLNFKCLNYFLAKEEAVQPQLNKDAKKVRLSRKDILGKRTISNFNIF